MKMLEDKYKELCELGVEFKKPIVLNTPDEWVKIAEILAKKNGGTLPSSKWLREHDYGGLYAAMKSYPNKFFHIKREKLRKTIDEQVRIAEKLTKENGGTLPVPSWLVKNGYESLYSAILLHPDKFFHIKQSKLNKTVYEQVVVAKRLMREHEGILPSYTWLMNNGYGDLATAMCYHPEKFNAIRREKLKKTIDEQVRIAEKLAEENGRMLPNYRWLLKNGYGDLYATMRNHPDEFIHIRRSDKLLKTPNEWVVIADKLTKGKNGVLPSHRWMCQNKYSGLSRSIYTYPKLFAHFNKRVA